MDGDGPDTARDEYLAGWAALRRLIESGASWSGNERNVCYLNLGDGRFADASFPSGLDFADDGRALADADWDGDGDIDLWLRNRTGPQLRYMQNDGPHTGRSVLLRPLGTRVNRDAVGATLRVEADGRVLTRHVRSGAGYLSQSSRWLHVGLGAAERVDGVSVRWPGGALERFTGVEPGGRFVLREGSGAALVDPVPPGAPPRSPAIRSTASFAAEPGARVLLRLPLPLPPSLRELIPDAGGDAAPRPRALLVNLWAQWCAPCIDELRAFAAAHEELRAAGVAVLPLSLDAPDDLAAAGAALGSVGWPVRESTLAASPGEGALETATILLRHILPMRESIALPTSLLIDPKGRLQVVYLGPTDPATVAADAARFALAAPRGADRGLWPGRWFNRTPRDLAGLSRALRDAGRVRDANFFMSLVPSRGTRPGRNR